jgi:hypothetical protein
MVEGLLAGNPAEVLFGTGEERPTRGRQDDAAHVVMSLACQTLKDGGVLGIDR